MITPETIQKFAAQAQTDEGNIAREYIQHLFLANLYHQEAADQVLFKGGTALRLIYGSPRFSEDLDFSSQAARPEAIESLIEATLTELEREGFAIRIEEAKETSGGYLGIVQTQFYSYDIRVKLEISFRAKSKLVSESSFIENDYIPGYTMIHLAKNHLIQEKINALLERGKPRDYFDLYFILRGNLWERKDKSTLKAISEKIETCRLDFKTELERFLGKSHQRLLKSFKQTLRGEINRFL